ncbi:MAG: hypothetical protein EOP48_22415 [Sphingobacteriales bacterium]|nr:MAG: hypothetical protein EOP48_22415 [Sphingobacteriales bacterium]
MSFIRNFFENLILVTAFQLGLTMSSMAQGMKQTQTLTHINYKTSNPSTTLIDSSFFAKIVALLDSESCSKSAKDSCVFYMWKAFSDPVNFDTAFEDPPNLLFVRLRMTILDADLLTVAEVVV